VIPVFHPTPANRWGDPPTESEPEDTTHQTTLADTAPTENIPLPEGMGAVGDLVSCAVDFLSITTGHAADPASLAAVLVLETTDPEPGGATKGFEVSESRSLVGVSSIWRKTGPYQASKRFGLDYECWEFPEAAAAHIVTRIPAGKAWYATRVDVAFDFKCHADCTADHVAACLRDHHMQLGIKPGVCGEGDVNTRFIGGKRSDVRLRIYRKDLEDPAFAQFNGPTLRVEIIFKGDRAVVFGSWFVLDPESAMLGASDMVHDVCGFRPLVGGAEWPQLVNPAPSDQAQIYMHFLKQNGGYIAALHDVGIDVAADAKRAGVASGTGLQRKRYRQRVKALRAAGPGDVADLAVLWLRGKVC